MDIHLQGNIDGTAGTQLAVGDPTGITVMLAVQLAWREMPITKDGILPILKAKVSGGRAPDTRVFAHSATCPVRNAGKVGAC